jgi:NADPH:quinone reductase-like Zn-dependent oxidoreductase
MNVIHRFLLAGAWALGVAAIPCSAAPDTMKAVRYASHGPASVLKLEDVPKPGAGPGQVLIRVEAAGVNPIDWKLRKGRPGATFQGEPRIPGFDVAGTVAAVGEGVTGYAVGDHVFALLDHLGGYAEYASESAARVAHTPKNLDAVHAAAIPTAGETAWRALFDEGELQRGQTVLIHGAAGGVGHFAVQFAKRAGARVLGTASPENHAFLKSIGADEVIDYKSQKFEDLVKDVDLVMDNVGGDTLKRSYGVVRKGGTIVTIAGRLDAAEMQKHELRMPSERELPPHLGEIAKAIEDGSVKVEVGTTYPLAEAQKAHEQSETLHARGKIVLVVAR